jgi:oligopeptide transport system substrate-binding protein
MPRRIAIIGMILLLVSLAPLSAQDAATSINWSIEGITDVVSLDPAKASDSQGFTVIGLMYAGLVRLNAELLVEPDLAESWTVSDDGLTYTFTLKEGAMFSDGSPITAGDVVFSLTHALTPSTGAWTGPYLLSNIAGSDELVAGESETLSGVSALDDRTVEITVKQPSAYFLSQLTFGPAKIISQAAAEADAAWDQAPVTSGAFALGEWRRGQGLTLVPNANYWQPASQISQIDLVFNQDSETAYQLFRTGELDIMGGSQNPIPAARVSEVQDSPDFVSVPNINIRYIGFNHEIAPFDNVLVRQAFARAIDKETLATAVLEGTVLATDRILPPTMPGAELPVEGLTFDPAAAQALLAEAGIDPAELEITLTYGVEGDNERILTVVESMWEEHLGVAVTLEPLELSTFSSRLNDTYNDPANGVQAYFSVWGTIYPDPQYFLSQVLKTGVGNNNGHYSNAEFDSLVDQADVIVGDFEQRASLYNQAEQIAVTEVGWLPLFNGKVNVLVRECVEGVEVVGLFSAYIVPDYSVLRGCPAA